MIELFGLCGLIAFAVSSALMPIAELLSKRLGAVSETGGRHVGRNPIGRLGGLGVIFGITSGLTVLSVLNSAVGSAFQLQLQQFLGLMIGTLLIGGVGFWDDIRRLSARWKFLVQILGATFAYIAGLRISAIDLPLLQPFQLGSLALPTTVIWIVGVVNAVNLIDGLDGLAGGVVLFAALVNFVAAISTGSMLSAGLMIAVSGAVMGFLLHNWHPAKIYLGDGGAYSLGFLLASSGLLSSHQKASTSVALLVPLLAAGLPIFDTLLTMGRRAINRRGIFTPDRGHLHHILLDAGISHRNVVIGLYMLSCVFCSIAVTMVTNRNRRVGIALIAASIAGSLYWGFIMRKKLLGIVSKNAKNKTPVQK